jgi:hypothetical protein
MRPITERLVHCVPSILVRDHWTGSSMAASGKRWARGSPSPEQGPLGARPALQRAEYSFGGALAHTTSLKRVPRSLPGRSSKVPTIGVAETVGVVGAG